MCRAGRLLSVRRKVTPTSSVELLAVERWVRDEMVGIQLMAAVIYMSMLVLGGIQLTRRGGGEPGPQARVRGKKRTSEGEGKKKEKKKTKEKEKKSKGLHVYDLRGPLPPAWGWVLGGRDERPPKLDTG